METKEFKKKIKGMKYIKITTKTTIFYEQAKTIKVSYDTKEECELYISTGEYMFINKADGFFRICKPCSGWTPLKEIKSVAPITEKGWKAIRLLGII